MYKFSTYVIYVAGGGLIHALTCPSTFSYVINNQGVPVFVQLAMGISFKYVLGIIFKFVGIIGIGRAAREILDKGKLRMLFRRGELALNFQKCMLI